MNHAFAIAAVTRTLRQLLDDGLNDLMKEEGFPDDLKPADDPIITALPPDKARDNNASRNQINLFLYHTTPNAAWRNLDVPGRIKPGETGSPPLALNLYYLLTAYSGGSNEQLSQVLLGAAMRLIHDHAVLGRDEIEKAFPGSGLNEQFERVRITPQPLSLEEMSKLWTTFQTQYRLSAAYEASVVLIDSQRPTSAPIPVLRRGQEDRGVETRLGKLPRIDEVRPTLKLPTVELGDELTIRGQSLTGDQVRVVFQPRRLVGASTTAAPEFQPEKITKLTEVEIRCTLPAPGNPADPTSPTATWRAGFHTAHVIVKNGDRREERSNAGGFALAPSIAVVLDAATADGQGTKAVQLTVNCVPLVDPQQVVSLLFADREVVSGPRTAASGSFTFTVDHIVPRADPPYVVRLRVDGVDSVPLKRGSTPPQFDTNQEVVVNP